MFANKNTIISTLKNIVDLLEKDKVAVAGVATAGVEWMSGACHDMEITLKLVSIDHDSDHDENDLGGLHNEEQKQVNEDLNKAIEASWNEPD